MKKENYKTHPGNIAITVVAIALILAGAVYFFQYWKYSLHYEETNDAQVESYINPVSARAGGYIQRVYFNEHQLVKQGDTLVVLDNREYRAQLEAAEAAMDDAHAQLTVLTAAIRSAETGTSINRDQIDGARARYVQQEQDIKRYTNLVKEEAATGADLEQVKARYDVAESDYNATQNGLKTNVARIAELKTHFALIEADIKRKQAALQLAQLNLSYTVIRAPYPGRLGRKNILEGQQIQPGQPLVSIINKGEKWITANYKETQVADMYLGQPVEIRVDAIDGKVFKGKIIAIAGSTGSRFSLLPADNSTGNFVKIIQRVPVKIGFTDEKAGNVIAGMNVTVAVKKGHKMMKPLYFKDWITDWHWGVRIALFLMLLSGLVQLGMFVLTQNYMVGYLGAQPEDIQFAVMATYSGIITVIALQFRFFRYFETRSYLLVSMMLAIGLNCVCIQCRDVTLFLVIRFFQGILTGNVLVFTLLLIFSRLPAGRAKTIAPAVFYGAILSNTVIIGLVAGVVVESADWKVTYNYLILFQLITLLIMLMMLRRSAGHRRYPLYQIDWAGMVIFACGMLALAYTVIYGSKYYWFADVRIVCSGFIALTMAILFLYRQHIIKRPFIHLDVFRSRNFMMGICVLAIYYGSKDSVNLIYNYAGSVLKWSALQIVGLSLCNLTGMSLLLVIAIRLMLAEKISIKVLLITGFATMAVSNIWLSFLLTPDLAFNDLLLPVFIQGAASGLLFVPLMIYVLSSAPAHTGVTGLVIAAFTRFTATLNSFAGFYNLQLYFNQYFKEGFLSYITSDNQNTIVRLNTYRSLYASKGFTPDQAAGLANAAVWQNLTQQSQLLTNRALFIIFAIVLLALALAIMIIPAIGKTIMYWRKCKIVPLIK